MLEIQVPSEARKEQITKLEEVCWTRPIPVNARVNIYLVGIFSCLNFPLLVNHRRLIKPRSRPLRSAPDSLTVSARRG